MINLLLEELRVRIFVDIQEEMEEICCIVV